MRLKLFVYCGTLTALAVGLGAALHVTSGPATRQELMAVGLLSALAVVAEGLSLALPNSAKGSIAFIPYIALAYVVPNSLAVIAVAAVQIIGAIARRRSTLLVVFNGAQFAVTVALVVLVYRSLGGRSLLTLGDSSLLNATIAVGIPAITAFIASFLINGMLVCGFLALERNRNFFEFWRSMIGPSIGFDLIVGPIVLIFAWLYSAHGAIAAAALWAPLLGLREVHKANLALQRSNEELLELMVKSIEARDLYTSGHSRRVHQYSLIIARALGVSVAESARISKASLLHDVGKIYEKYAPILRKPEKLTQEEWTTMKEHPVDGANLIATISGLKDVVPLVRHHHENWDGTGYPDGLRGDQIPLASRIIAFADTIDAMTSERPYRQPLSETHVRAEIIRHRGRQFDPIIADRLLSSELWHTLFQPPRQSTANSGLHLIRAKKETA